jgi:hypothetical protein
LRDQDPAIKILTIDTIAHSIPPAQRIPLLKQAAADSNEMVRNAASTWLVEGLER